MKQQGRPHQRRVRLAAARQWRRRGAVGRRRSASLARPVGVPSWSYSLGVLSVVALVLLGRLAFAAHMLLVPHSVCHHGALVHWHVAGNSPQAQVHQHGQRPAVSSRALSDGSHEHCDVLGVKEARPTVSLPKLPARVLSWQLWAASPPVAVVGAAVPLLLLAPKHSPPQA